MSLSVPDHPVTVAAGLRGVASAVNAHGGQPIVSVTSAPEASYKDKLGASAVLGALGALFASLDGIAETAFEPEQWITLVSDASAALTSLNETLADRVFLIGRDLSVIDVFVAAALRQEIAALDATQKFQLLNVSRWFDLIQHVQPFGQDLVPFELTVPAEFLAAAVKEENKKEEDVAAEKKKKKKEKAAAQSDKKEDSALDEIAKLDIRVGIIKAVQLHPTNADLYVEEIDVGEGGTRTVVSGLARFVPIEAMQNRLVALVLNLGEADIKGVASNGLVLCASNEEHTIVEPLEPPLNSPIGERVTFPGAILSEPDAKLNSKKWVKIKKKLQTNSDSPRPVATFDNVSMTTSVGVITVPTLKNSFIK
eukprot:TRINITY_DN2630_c0_g1_i1.p1 TRINITY_DN2630_c0_g1~~TRINITY_DN2630_c0_g1_i1.p1  ORF type:complete len:367 (+),score=123.34 TRINITY_DN2630_c0_g1_i1:111-1211(+)